MAAEPQRVGTPEEPADARADDARDGWPFRFACRRSGNCCAVPGGVVRVDEREAAAIAAHLGLDGAAFRSRYLDATGTRLVDGLGNRCVFLREGGEASCTIHPVRPAKCRTWPFWPELRQDPALLAAAQRRCPGIEPLPVEQPR